MGIKINLTRLLEIMSKSRKPLIPTTDASYLPIEESTSPYKVYAFELEPTNEEGE